MKKKYIKFEQDAIIILDAIDDREIPVKDLKFCGFCTLPDKRPVYHYSPSSPAKPVSTYVVEINGRVDKPHEETGGGFTIISMGKIESDKIKKEAKL